MASSPHRPPHVLAFPFPAQGHINPMTLLCRRLSSMGILVTFITTGSFDQGDGDDHFRYVTISDDCFPKIRIGNNLQLFLNAMEAMKPEVERVIDQLMSDSTTSPLTCIISDAFFSWTQDLARQFGICRASLWTPSTSCALISVQFSLLESHGLLPTGGSTEVIDFIPGLPPLPASDFPVTIQVEDEDDPGFKLRRYRNEIMSDDAWVFVNSFYDMESSQSEQLKKDIPGFINVGPLQDSEDSSTRARSVWKEDVSCLEWLDEQEERSVVYISFGSLATLKREEVEEIRVGLERSGYGFLWVMRQDLLDEGEGEVLSRIKENRKGKVISWAPQVKVLGHRSVGAFLSHCGWNSIMEAVVAGVPMMCRPCFGDQTLNCAILVDFLKVGVRVTESGSLEVSARRMEEAVNGMMSEEGEEFRKRVKELSRAAVSAVEAGGSSLANLERFVLDMKRRSSH